MVKFGMFTPTAANVLTPLSGMVKFVKVYPNAHPVKPSTVTLSAHAPMAISGVKISAFTLPAQEVKSGLDQNVCALQVSTTTEECALNVLMVKNGMPRLQLALVNQATSGMDNIVRNPTAAPTEESGAQFTTNVFVPMDLTGVDTPACQLINAQEDNTSIPP